MQHQTGCRRRLGRRREERRSREEGGGGEGGEYECAGGVAERGPAPGSQGASSGVQAVPEL